MSQQNELPITDIMDVITYLQSLADEMYLAKADDGKIDMKEIVAALATTSPTALAAWVGSDNISAQAADISDEERERILTASLRVVQTFGKIFAKVPQPKAD